MTTSLKITTSIYMKEPDHNTSTINLERGMFIKISWRKCDSLMHLNSKFINSYYKFK